MLFNAVGGGTGSGFSSLLLEKIKTDYSKVPNMNFAIYPSPLLSTSVVEPYNTVLSTHSMLENTKISVLFDNEALYDIAKYKLDIE